ncbi:MAG: hypothetical protein WC441_02140 [Patescibacteria group bacterium]
MLDLSDKIIAKIEEQKIKPRPKWQFMVKKYAVLTLAIASLLLGGLSFSVIFHLLNNQDWTWQSIDRSHFFLLILNSLPLAWLAFFVLFIVVLCYNFRQLKHGYRYPVKTIALSALVTMIFFGTLAAILGINRQVHNLLNRVPVYQNTFDSRLQAWDRPQAGFLTGRIKEFNQSGFTLENPHLKNWQVIVSPKTIIDPELEGEINERVRVFGFVSLPGSFIAQEIKPWERMRPREGLMPPPMMR